MPRLQAGVGTFVMKCLAGAGGGIVSHARLAQAVYGEAPPPTARGTIQVAIARLRQRYPGSIETHHKLGYSLKPGSALARAAVRPIRDKLTT